MSKEITNSEEFIRNIVGSNTGFSVPENYFEEVDAKVMSAFSETEIPKQTAFDIPQDYFATLEDKILAKVTSEEKTAKVISFKDRVLRFIPVAAAASVLLFIGLNYFNTETITLDDISSDELTAWLENSSDEFNTEELAMVFDEDDFDEDDFSITTIDEITLEEYLNTIDSDTLLNEIQ